MADESPHRPLAKLSNEFAVIELELDTTAANDPRLRIVNIRDEQEIYLDAVALSLICSADEDVFDLLADLARDEAARDELATWSAQRRARRGGGAA